MQRMPFEVPQGDAATRGLRRAASAPDELPPQQQAPLSHAPAPATTHPRRFDDQADFFDRPVNSILQAAREAIVMVDERHTIVAVNAAAERDVPLRRGRAARPAAFRPGARRARRATRGAGAGYLQSAELQQHWRRTGASTRAAARRQQLPGRDHAVGGRGAAPRAARTSPRSSSTAASRAGCSASSIAFKRRLRSVFELAPVATWIADNERVVFANQTAERLFGEASGWPVGRPVYELLGAPSRDALRAQVARALQGEPDVQVVRGHVARADGSQREVEIALAALPDHGRTTVQMVVADVTEQRREAAALAESREGLRRLGQRGRGARGGAPAHRPRAAR